MVCNISERVGDCGWGRGSPVGLGLKLASDGLSSALLDDWAESVGGQWAESVDDWLWGYVWRGLETEWEVEKEKISEANPTSLWGGRESVR